MSKLSSAIGAGALTITLGLGATAAIAQSTGYTWSYGFGSTPSAEELAQFAGLSAQPDGRGAPPGKGTYEEGKKLFAEGCAACHGEKLEGLPMPGPGGDKLIGGRGTLAAPMPVKTVESFWPYASTLFDYIKRAMPFNSPGTLTNDQVYALTAYILAEGNIIPKTHVLDASNLGKVDMPNKNGFVPDPRPEIELYR